MLKVPKYGLELLLALSCIVFIGQLYPFIFSSIVFWIDVRHWSWTIVWFVNLVIVVSLIGYRAWINR